MVNEQQIRRLAERIVEAVQPEKIILFGSHAYGTPDNASDVDLLIIMPFEGRSSDASNRLWDILRPDFAVDLLVRRPDDTARRYEEWDPLVREALDKGKVMYERDSHGVGGEGGRRLPRRGAGV